MTDIEKDIEKIKRLTQILGMEEVIVTPKKGVVYEPIGKDRDTGRHQLRHGGTSGNCSAADDGERYTADNPNSEGSPQ